MYKHLIVFGAGGHGQTVADLALSSGDCEKVSFVDDSYPDNTTQHIKRRCLSNSAW
jgi:saccharopine dehydrogenase-like NADP-dependent oxidoreductase